jgi:ribosomal protein S18 acetylase RimI-like enzyme
MSDDVRLDRLARSDFPAIRALGVRIWREHYTGFLSREQVEYMLSGRYEEADLREYVNGDGRWFWVLRSGGGPIGFVRCALLSANELKLEEIYLEASHRGHGYGARMIRHVESHAHALGCRTLVLSVNRRNVESIGVYEKVGFTVREAVVSDIGGGFVMDDYVMEKRL